MLQRNLENVEALLDAGATFKGDEHRIAQNILSSVPDVEIAELLGFPTVDDNGDPIDQHEMFAWARETRYARETCADSLKVFRARTKEFLTGVGTLTLGEFDPKFPPAAVLEELDEYTLVATSSTLVDRVDSEKWLTSTWGSSGSSGYEYMFILVSRHDPVFCAFMAIGY